LDALAAMESETVHLEMKSALSPCVVKPEGDPGFLCVVMPMKV
jgi:DNA polymerase III sliding clamp (beta) subunit (PCNA family)